jgi:hypothetical protein
MSARKTSMPPEIQHYVALDLGSESMAAYYESSRADEGEMISLQAHAAELLGHDSPDLLTDKGQESPRLRTRIGLEDGRQPHPLPLSHAMLDFLDPENRRLDGYYESLFSYFYLPDQEFGRAIMPNPKIPFQEGGAKVVPRVEATGSSKPVRHSPEQLLQHLTVQVLRNLVLRSPQLRHIDPKEIHLVLTVPNVYSLVHVKNLVDFIKANAGVGDVSFLYESDAVSYLLLDAPRDDGPEDFEAFKRRIRGRKNQQALRIATIDIGRGTTDLSLIEIQTPQRTSTTADRSAPATGSDQRQHFVFARTGKSDGGNRLSYIFASYYEEVVRQTFASHKRIPPFSFLEVRGSVGAIQAFALAALEDLIEEVKFNMTREFHLRLSEARQLELVDAIIHQLMHGLDPSWNGNGNPADRGLRELFVGLRRNLVLPGKLPRNLRGWLLSVRRSAKEQGGVDEERLVALRNEIESYVRSNVVQLIDELAGMAEKRERLSKRTEALDKANTFVLVAGQASQFAPVAHAIREHLAKVYDLPAENIHFLRSSDAKEACCRGAVHFLRSEVNLANQEELHGIYGFLNAAALGEKDTFEPADMSLIRSGGVCTVTFDVRSQYWLIFSPRVEIEPNRPPKLHDGTTAVISSFRGSQFKVRYDPDRLALFVNDEEVRLATYGNIKESIYPKIWPEVLRPAKS